MKKGFILALMIVCGTFGVLAAEFDLIIKTNSEKIEALIQEVSDSEIRYKKANNPNGPMFVIKTDDVASILFSNGEVQAIEHKAKPQQNNNYSYGSSIYDGPMQRVDKDVFMIDGRTLKGRELMFFLQQNCPRAYNYRKSMQDCEIAGWVLLGSGTVLFTAGIIYSFVTNSSNWKAVTYGICSAGGCMMVGSVPLIACGNVYKKRVDEVYNTYCGRQQAFQPELRLTSSPNGLGLALAF